MDIKENNVSQPHYDHSEEYIQGGINPPSKGKK